MLPSRVWNTLTDNYGNVMAVDWKTSHTRSLHLPTLNLVEHEVTQTYMVVPHYIWSTENTRHLTVHRQSVLKCCRSKRRASSLKNSSLTHLLSLSVGQKLDNQSLDLSDDEELREQMDMHSIIVSTINDEPLFTAEQVPKPFSRHPVPHVNTLLTGAPENSHRTSHNSVFLLRLWAIDGWIISYIWHASCLRCIFNNIPCIASK